MEEKKVIKYKNRYEEGILKDNLKEGKWVSYKYDGTIISWYTYSKNLLNGPAQESVPCQIEKGNYKDNKRVGLWRIYSEYEILMFEGEYIENKKEGTWIEYYDDGQIESKIPYKNNIKEGIGEVFYPNGVLACTILYKEDKAYNTIDTYDIEGTKIDLNRIEKGIKQGLWIDYGHSKGTYLNGYRIGLWEYYHPNGSCNYKETLSMIPSDPDLEPEEPAYENIVRHGEYLRYHNNGNLEYSANYYYGKKHGLITNYDKDGNVMETTQYRGGVMHGETIRYYPNGSIKVKGQCNNGKTFGEWITYTPTGTIISIENF